MSQRVVAAVKSIVEEQTVQLDTAGVKMAKVINSRKEEGASNGTCRLKQLQMQYNSEADL